jgi:hypothetical protein
MHPVITVARHDKVNSRAIPCPVAKMERLTLDVMRAALMRNPHIDLRMFRLDRSTQ